MELGPANLDLTQMDDELLPPDGENPELDMVDALEWYSSFRYAADVIAGKCTLAVLQKCREWEAVSLVEDVEPIFQFLNNPKKFQYYKWWRSSMTLRAMCKNAIEKFFVIEEIPHQLRRMM